MSQKRVIIATPHSRYDDMENTLREREGIDVLRIRTPGELMLASMVEFAPRYVFFPHWSWKIPAQIFETFECVVFHMADVPFGRGGSPLQNLIARGFEDTKLSALRCVEEFDAGPVYLKRSLSLLGTAEEIFFRATTCMTEMIGVMLRDQPIPQPQVGEVVIFKRRTAEQGNLSVEATLKNVHDVIRMLDAEGYPHAFVEVGALRFEFTRASRSQSHVMADVRITLKDEDTSK